QWDGTSWAIVTSPDTSATKSDFLRGVACASASQCWAVGYFNYNGNGYTEPRIEQWDGTSWAIVTSNTDALQGNVLYGVTCGSASQCWAVGGFQGSTDYQTLIEQWDGTSWSPVTSPDTSAMQANGLQSVACASASQCWAVGSYSGG